MNIKINLLTVNSSSLKTFYSFDFSSSFVMFHFLHQYNSLRLDKNQTGQNRKLNPESFKLKRLALFQHYADEPVYLLLSQDNGPPLLHKWQNTHQTHPAVAFHFHKRSKSH